MFYKMTTTLKSQVYYQHTFRAESSFIKLVNRLNSVYGISILVGYLMKILFIHTLDIWFMDEYFVGNILNKPEIICWNTVKWFRENNEIFLFDL